MASQAQASNNDINVEIHGAPPDVTNTTAYRGLKDSAYAPGNAKPESPEPAPKNKGTRTITPPEKGNANKGTNAETGSLTAALLAYQAQINKAENDK